MQLLGNQTDRHQTRVFMALRNNQNVVFDVFIDHIPRFFGAVFGATDTQTFTLTEGVIHQPLVLTNFIAIDGNDFARLRREITAQELAEFTLADKADTGRIFFLRGDQTKIFSNLTHLRFFQFADREQALRNLLMAERIKEVALVFIAVQATQQAALAIDICPTYVMTGSDIIGT